MGSDEERRIIRIEGERGEKGREREGREGERGERGREKEEREGGRRERRRIRRRGGEE